MTHHDSDRVLRFVLAVSIMTPTVACGEHSEPSTELTAATPVAVATAALDVSPPNLSIPDVGYYCSAIWPTAGWMLLWGAAGNGNSNPCSAAAGASLTRTGVYRANGTNIVEAWCEPNYYWYYVGYGDLPLGWAYNSAATTTTNGNCLFRVTVGDALRQPITGPTPMPAPPPAPLPLPSATGSYTFFPSRFASYLASKLNTTGSPAPVGFQIAIRDPNGMLVHSQANGYVTAGTSLPMTVMTKDRRFDVASMSKTITAVAVVAAFEDLATPPHNPSLGLTLDSSIRPYLPSNWTIPSTVDDVTFRMVLRHTAGFCAPGKPNHGGDSYSDVENMIAYGPVNSEKGKWNYCNAGYALLRILLPYVVDGPQAYRPFESDKALNARLTATSYRNYVRGRIFDRIGLTAVDAFYTGPDPLTVYYDSSLSPIDNEVNINLPSPSCTNDQRANRMVIEAGSGNWNLSAEEYSLFISKLWKREIVSASSLDTMIAQYNPSGNHIGIGNYGSEITLPDGSTFYDFNEGGGGGCGGPAGIWMTFFNGYTAVWLSNTAYGVPMPTFELMEESFLASLTPSTWTCPLDFYNRHDGCDCACDAWDPDCEDPVATQWHCRTDEYCSQSLGGRCVAACAGATARQHFSEQISGCAGQVSFANRASLCATGFHVCSPSEWIALRGAAAPEHNFWTNAPLRYYSFRTDTTNHCKVTLSTGLYTNACSAGKMLVTSPTQPDPEGNTAVWTGCGYNSYTSSYFGGCASADKAGALCCQD